MNAHLFLIGFMGSGKSRWGMRLAQEKNRPFLDLDHLIEQGEQQSIAEIFAAQGETGFRLLEQKYLHALADLPESVVSLGGGTPCFFDNMVWINRHGRSIYLRVPLTTLIGRLQGKAAQRPLLTQLPLEEWPLVLENMLEARTPFYEQAQQTVEYAGDDADFFARLCSAAQVS